MTNMQVVKAVDSLYSEFRAVDNLVACNASRVLKAFQNARLGSHVSTKTIYMKLSSSYFQWLSIKFQVTFKVSHVHEVYKQIVTFHCISAFGCVLTCFPLQE